MNKGNRTTWMLSGLAIWLLVGACFAYGAPYAAIPVALERHDPESMVFDPVNERIFVANADCDLPGVSIVNTVTMEISYLDAETMVTRLFYDQSAQRLYVASNVGLRIYQWSEPDRNFVVYRDQRFQDPDADCGDGGFTYVSCMDVDKQRNELFLARTSRTLDAGLLNFARLDLNSDSAELEQVSLPGISQIWGMAVDELNGKVYVTDYWSARVIVIDSAELRIERAIPVGPGPRDIKLIDPSREVFYVTSMFDRTISVIEGRTLVKTISTGKGYAPHRILVHPTEPRAYIANLSTGKPGMIMVMDTSRHRTVDVIPVGLGPTGMSLSTVSGNLVVCNSQEDTLSIVDTATNDTVQVLKTDNEPYDSLAHPSLNKAFFISRSENTFSLLTIPPDPDKSVVFADPVEIPMDGQASSLITVIPRDKDGNDLGPARSVVVMATVGTLLDQVLDLQDGTYTQDLQSISPANRYSPYAVSATIRAEVDGVQLNDKPLVSFVSSVNVPSIVILEPSWDFTGGGRTIQIQGKKFGTNARVFFDGLEATSYLLRTDTEIRCTDPAHPADVVDVVIEVPVNSKASFEPSGSGGADDFYYAVAPDGFEYIEAPQLELICISDESTSATILVWDAPGGPVDVLRADNKQFSSGLNLFESVLSPLTDPESLSPGSLQIFYYRIVE